MPPSLRFRRSHRCRTHHTNRGATAGRAGTGKSMFFTNLMGKLFGGLFRLCSSSQELLTQFNESIATRVLITCDEAGFFGGFRGEGPPICLTFGA